MNKLITMVAAAGSSLALLAQEGESSGAAQEIITGAQESLTGMLETASGAVVAVVLAGLAIWGGIRLVGLLKSAFNAGKGR